MEENEQLEYDNDQLLSDLNILQEEYNKLIILNKNNNKQYINKLYKN